MLTDNYEYLKNHTVNKKVISLMIANAKLDTFKDFFLPVSFLSFLAIPIISGVVGYIVNKDEGLFITTGLAGFFLALICMGIAEKVVTNIVIPRQEERNEFLFPYFDNLLTNNYGISLSEEDLEELVYSSCLQFKLLSYDRQSQYAKVTVNGQEIYFSLVQDFLGWKLLGELPTVKDQ